LGFDYIDGQLKMNNNLLMIRMSNAIVIFVVMVAFVLTATPSPKAYAVGSSGFENASFSTRSLARGNASVADASDPSTIAFNPAGLTRLEGMQSYAGSSFIHVKSNYEATEGRSDENSSETVVPVPYFYATYETPIEDFYFGIGMNSPFGLISRWPSDGAFKYIAHFSEIKTAAYHMSFAYRISPNLSVGAGWTHMNLELQQNGKFNSAALTGDAQDAPFEIDEGGGGNGWNLGLLWDITEQDTLGMFFRSEVRTHLKGTMNTDNLTGVIAGAFGGATSTVSAVSDVTLPANITIGLKHQFDEKFDMEFDLGWTGWSSNDSFNTTFGTSNAVLVGFENIDRDYEDVFSFHIGASYDLNPIWTVNGGYYFYQRAANEATYTNENADGHRNGFSAGLEYNKSNWSIDFMYEMVFIGDETIENTKGVTNGTDIDGNYSGFIQLTTTGLRYRF
jgi:long-chain fatty acid transport protein